MTIVNEVKFEKPIILVKLLEDDDLVVVDSETTIRFVDKKRLKLLSGFKANIHHLRYKTSVVAFAQDGTCFASMSSDCRDSKLYNTETKVNLAKMNRHHGEVSCVGIDPKVRYMFSCGDDGKTFAVDVKSGKIAFTLPVHVDTINDIAFSDNGQWVATASYDRKVSIFHLEMMTPKHRIKLHSAPVVKLLFIGNQRVVSADKNSKIIATDVYSGKIIARLEGVHDDITQLTKSADNKFLFVGTALGYILVYDLDSYELLSRDYIKLSSAITALEYDKERQYLIIGTEASEVKIYDIYEGKTEIKEFLTAKKYDKIEELTKINPILRYTKVYEMIEVIWEKVFEKVKAYLEMGEKDRAVKIFLPL